MCMIAESPCNSNSCIYIYMLYTCEKNSLRFRGEKLKVKDIHNKQQTSGCTEAVYMRFKKNKPRTTM